MKKNERERENRNQTMPKLVLDVQPAVACADGQPNNVRPVSSGRNIGKRLMTS